jgi:hypothetical protein
MSNMARYHTEVCAANKGSHSDGIALAQFHSGMFEAE